MANPFREELARRETNPFRAEQQRRGLLTGAMRTADDFVRSVADAATFGLADEAAAMASSVTGIGGQPGSDGSYDANLSAERSRDDKIPLGVQIPGMIAGAVINPLARFSMAQKADTARKAMVVGAGEGALYGAAYGAGSGKGAEGRIDGAYEGGLIGAGFGGVAGGIASKLTKTKAKPVSTEEFKAQAHAAYKAADGSDAVITPESFRGFTSKLAADLADEAIDADLHPRAMTVLKRLMGQDKPLSLKGAETLRKLVGHAASSADPSEKRLAMMMRDHLDDFIEDLPGTEALKQGRALWRKARKAEFMDEILERASIRSTQYSNSGMENAIRTELRQVLMNPKKRRMFDQRELTALKRAVEGSNLENMMRLLGKFAPTGVVSSTASSMLGNQVAGPVGMAALPALGFGAKKVAEGSARHNLSLADMLVRGGGTVGRREPTMIENALLKQLGIGGPVATQQIGSK